MAGAARSGTHPLDAMLAVSTVIQNSRLARLYVAVLERGTPTVDELVEGVTSSKTTVYEDLNRLVDIGVLERVTDGQPHRYRARSVEMTIQADGDTFEVTPTLLVGLARRETNENLELYTDRHGVSGLATAIEYARAYIASEMTARIMAREQEIPVLEAETILQELEELCLEIEADSPPSLDIEALDEAVDEQLNG